MVVVHKEEVVVLIRDDDLTELVAIIALAKEAQVAGLTVAIPLITEADVRGLLFTFTSTKTQINNSKCHKKIIILRIT